MGIINTQALQNGMKILSPVKDHSGRIVLHPGTVVEEKHHRIIRMWGITEIDVAGSGDVEGNPDLMYTPDVGAMELAASQARELFRHCNMEHIVIQQLFQITVRNLLSQISGGGK